MGCQTLIAIFLRDALRTDGSPILAENIGRCDTKDMGGSYQDLHWFRLPDYQKSRPEGIDRKSNVGKALVLWSAEPLDDTLHVMPVEDAWWGK